MVAVSACQDGLGMGPPRVETQRVFFIDNLLVRIHFIFVMIWWTGLAPWEFEFPLPGSLTSTLHDVCVTLRLFSVHRDLRHTAGYEGEISPSLSSFPSTYCRIFPMSLRHCLLWGLCPYGIAYCRVYECFTGGLFKSSLGSPLWPEHYGERSFL